MTNKKNEIQESLSSLKKKIASLQSTISKLSKQNKELIEQNNDNGLTINRLINEKREKEYTNGFKIELLLKEQKENVRKEYVQSISEFEQRNAERMLIQNTLEIETKTTKGNIYKLAHSINNDLHNAAQILKSKDSDDELTNAFYHIKRIDDLVKLNLWLLKKNELLEEWKTLDLSKEIEELITSTKRGLSTLRVSAEFQIKLAQLNVTTT